MAKAKTKRKNKTQPRHKFVAGQGEKSAPVANGATFVHKSEEVVVPEANMLNLDELPEYLSEEELDEFLVKSGILDKLLAQIKGSKPSRNWQDELDEFGSTSQR
jgi:hypothetical protein